MASRLALAPLAAVLLAAAPAAAAPEAHVFRIAATGPSAATTVVEVAQNKRVADVLLPCAMLARDAQLDCVGDTLEKPGALYSTFAFPEKNALLTIDASGSIVLATFDTLARWGDSTGQPGVGTAWLIAIDALSSMGTRFFDAQEIAGAFADALRPNDVVDVVFFNDRGVVMDSKWVTGTPGARAAIAAVPRPYPATGRSRPLGDILEAAATDAFRDLFSAGMSVPLHQAMVVISNGNLGWKRDVASAQHAKAYLSDGRFPASARVHPRMPVPIVSIWLPTPIMGAAGAERDFMLGLANTEMGGFYTAVRDGRKGRGPGIVNAVRARFDKMHIVRWSLPCGAPGQTQTFKLVFTNTIPPIAGDATFQDVPFAGLSPCKPGGP